MSILIKGMEMPKCCDDCFALDDYGDYPHCLISSTQQGYTFRTREKRMSNCPLIEVSDDVQPVVHGKWEFHVPEEAELREYYSCSECGKRALFDYFTDFVQSNYCPNCGARMDGEP